MMCHLPSSAKMSVVLLQRKYFPDDIIHIVTYQILHRMSATGRNQADAVRILRERDIHTETQKGGKGEAHFKAVAGNDNGGNCIVEIALLHILFLDLVKTEIGDFGDYEALVEP